MEASRIYRRRALCPSKKRANVERAAKPLRYCYSAAGPLACPLYREKLPERIKSIIQSDIGVPLHLPPSSGPRAASGEVPIQCLSKFMLRILRQRSLTVRGRMLVILLVEAHPPKLFQPVLERYAQWARALKVKASTSNSDNSRDRGSRTWFAW